MNKNTWKIVIRPMGALAAAAILMASVPSWGLAQVQAAAQAQAEPGRQAAVRARSEPLCHNIFDKNSFRRGF